MHFLGGSRFKKQQVTNCIFQDFYRSLQVFDLSTLWSCYINQKVFLLHIWFESRSCRGVPRCNIMSQSLSVACGSLVVFHLYSGFLHQHNWPPRWNIVESGAKHNNFTPPTPLLHICIVSHGIVTYYDIGHSLCFLWKKSGWFGPTSLQLYFNFRKVKIVSFWANPQFPSVEWLSD